MRCLFLLCFLVYAPHSFSQIKLSNSFQRLLEQSDLAFSPPLENRFKVKRSLNNPLLKSHFTIKQRRGDLEVRYLIRPDNGNNSLMTIPHVQTMSTLSTIATNDQDAVISLHSLDSINYLQVQGAEWGIEAYFQPKSAFSTKKHGKLVSLYKENKALVYIIYLFDQPSEALEQSAYTLAFKKEI